MNTLYIGLAGALGSMSRYLLGAWLVRILGDEPTLPAGTFVINVLGSFAIGVLAAIFVGRGDVDSRVRMVLAIGFLGGFTTYSSFALETVGLLENRNLGPAFWYVGMTLLCGGLACFLGLTIGRRI